MVSVIVPVYNIEDYLERCVNSILNQTFSDFELILSDDGSQDRSGTICDEFALKDSRVKVVHKENGGSSSARNEAMKIAKGRYYSFIDSDDYIEPDFLERLTAPIVTAEAEGKKAPLIVQIGRNEIDEEGNRLPDICIPPKEDVFIPSEDFFRELILHKGDCSYCTKLTAAGLFEGIEFPVGKLNEDFHILIRMLLMCEGVMSLSGYGYHVFYKSNSNTRTGKQRFSRVYQDNIDNADEVTGIVDEHFPKLHSIAIRFNLFQRLDYLLHIPIADMRKDYEGYSACVSYIRKHWFEGMASKYLTVKNKVYLTLFAVAPRFVRSFHAKIKRM